MIGLRLGPVVNRVVRVWCRVPSVAPRRGCGTLAKRRRQRTARHRRFRPWTTEEGSTPRGRASPGLPDPEVHRLVLLRRVARVNSEGELLELFRANEGALMRDDAAVWCLHRYLQLRPRPPPLVATSTSTSDDPVTSTPTTVTTPIAPTPTTPSPASVAATRLVARATAALRDTRAVANVDVDVLVDLVVRASMARPPLPDGRLIAAASHAIQTRVRSMSLQQLSDACVGLVTWMQRTDAYRTGADSDTVPSVAVLATVSVLTKHAVRRSGVSLGTPSWSSNLGLLTPVLQAGLRCESDGLLPSAVVVDKWAQQLAECLDNDPRAVSSSVIVQAMDVAARAQQHGLVGNADAAFQLMTTCCQALATTAGGRTFGVAPSPQGKVVTFSEAVTALASAATLHAHRPVVARRRRRVPVAWTPFLSWVCHELHDHFVVTKSRLATGLLGSRRFRVHELRYWQVAQPLDSARTPSWAHEEAARNTVAVAEALCRLQFRATPVLDDVCDVLGGHQWLFGVGDTADAVVAMDRLGHGPGATDASSACRRAIASRLGRAAGDTASGLSHVQRRAVKQWLCAHHGL